MTGEQQRPLTPNGNGAQLYLGRDLLDDTACPLAQGQEVTATVIDGIGVLLTEVDDDREYAVEPDPDQMTLTDV
ncbi:hypothetical protein C2R22_24565 (plasmid) [Salinigranum rubrum]|uniref:Uncharacterized protein n=1 Tax=Salinigranum rubrum TaxID=755307 RepID=A0A2I8VS24_9EURY|nr:hypothetical protein [Salinigranum rubrum]AUV84705.1 hypothetical protein C2R22_24565 [Salinigranum rubrum]